MHKFGGQDFTRPTLEDVSNLPVLIYDGDCQFCQLSLDFGIRNLRVFPRYAAFQGIDPSKFGLTEQMVRSQIWLVSDSESPTKLLGGHLAAIEILSMQPQKYLKLLASIMKLWPWRIIADKTYKWVAKNRHRLPGGSKTCELKDNYLD